MLLKIAQLSSIGFAVIDELGKIAKANQAFCNMFALDAPAKRVDRSLCEHIASRFNTTFPELNEALKCADAAIFELHLQRGSEPLIVLIAERREGRRMLVVDRLPRLTINFGCRSMLSRNDPLTGLGDRTLLEEIIGNWQPRHPDDLSLAVIMIDLDRFKQVNDTLGHGAGDILLKMAAKRISSAARSEDTVIRIGADEFVIIHTAGEQPMAAEAVAKRIVELIGQPFLIGGQPVNVGASIGIAALNQGTDDKSELLKHADLALYAAKCAGRGNIKLFEPVLAQRANQRRELEIDLRRALDLGEFSLVYQPQVNIPDGALVGFEALIRWHHPRRGLISPTDFIPLAEEIGEIHVIGEWVMHTACRAATTWSGAFTVAVNVSPIQFENDRIIDVIKKALAHSRLAPERLEIEITEGVLMKDPATVLKHLWAIKSLGVGIAMDDFGTGYSSLSYLNSFPFSKLKIDQSFVRGDTSHKSRALVKAIVALGESLNMNTLAEGVESEEQLKALAAGGCTEAQGYLISKPIPSAEIAEFIAAIGSRLKNKGRFRKIFPSI